MQQYLQHTPMLHVAHSRLCATCNNPFSPRRVGMLQMSEPLLQLNPQKSTSNIYRRLPAIISRIVPAVAGKISARPSAFSPSSASLRISRISASVNLRFTCAARAVHSAGVALCSSQCLRPKAFELSPADTGVDRVKVLPHSGFAQSASHTTSDVRLPSFLRYGRCVFSVKITPFLAVNCIVIL